MALSKSAIAEIAQSHTKPVDIPWRDRPFLTMQAASAIAGVSTASIYQLEKAGQVQLRKFAGRTVVETTSFIAAMDKAEPWRPGNKGVAATAARSARSRASWAD